MKLVNGSLLVAVGLVVLWLAVTGRLERVGAAWGALTGAPVTGPNGEPIAAPSGSQDAGGASPGGVLALDPLTLPDLPELLTAGPRRTG